MSQSNNIPAAYTRQIRQENHLASVIFSRLPSLAVAVFGLGMMAICAAPPAAADIMTQPPSEVRPAQATPASTPAQRRDADRVKRRARPTDAQPLDKPTTPAR